MPRRHKGPPPPATEFRLASGERVELGALLKAVGICGTGGEAKHRVQGGEVKVNGAVETRRGRKLVAGDRVATHGRVVQLVAAAAGGGAPA